MEFTNDGAPIAQQIGNLLDASVEVEVLEEHPHPPQATYHEDDDNTFKLVDRLPVERLHAECSGEARKRVRQDAEHDLKCERHHRPPVTLTGNARVLSQRLDDGRTSSADRQTFAGEGVRPTPLGLVCVQFVHGKILLAVHDDKHELLIQQTHTHGLGGGQSPGLGGSESAGA